MKKQVIIVLSLLMTLGVYAQHDHGGMSKENAKMDHSKHRSMDMSKDGIMSYDVSSEFRDQLKEVFMATVPISELFISEKSQEISVKAIEIKGLLAKVDMSLLTSSEAHMDWMMYLKQMNSALDGMSKGVDLANQKVEYASYNVALYQSIKTFNVSGSIFYQHCPMALDSKGAYWLSASEEIRNPYLGNMMLSCGSTKETIN